MTPDLPSDHWKSDAIPGPDPGSCERCGAWRKAGMNHDCEQERERYRKALEEIAAKWPSGAGSIAREVLDV